MKMKDKNIYSVIQRSVATKNLGYIRFMLSRSFVTLADKMIGEFYLDTTSLIYDYE